ncbi:MAG: glycerol-3-phosphate acyltransferase [Coriobacteriia bacterium]|nr:glycerol-3-phosphate acyltransferase [Coriobacteriia bacterium]
MMSIDAVGHQWTWVAVALGAAYLIGSIPFAYLIVLAVTGQDVTTHGTGNVGAMNVRRSTGSWSWFALAMVADAAKGFAPALAAKMLVVGYGFAEAIRTPWGVTLSSVSIEWTSVPAFSVPMAAVAGAVLGHNYSVWMALIKRQFHRTGKGLATGGGALLAYDWRYFVAVVVVGLTVIAITRYMMAGQVAAALTLPVTAILLDSPDWPFALVMGAVVYAAHHRRFVGMLRGKEPRLYVNDRMGPRG